MASPEHRVIIERFNAGLEEAYNAELHEGVQIITGEGEEPERQLFRVGLSKEKAEEQYSFLKDRFAKFPRTLLENRRDSSAIMEYITLYAGNAHQCITHVVTVIKMEVRAGEARTDEKDKVDFEYLQTAINICYNICN